MNVLHITSRKAWIEATRAGSYSAPSLREEGFIHASTLKQLLSVAAKYYRGQTGLIVLEINLARLKSEMKWESPAGCSPPPGVPEGDAFPHVYGPINLDAVVQVLEFEADANGEFALPPGLTTGS